ncbi:hypothetical protein [Methylobrevis albus]|uniref:Ig-like domain-containing protein n=1 Tax=Methylobrevis albus TaxID=2793297 RepID=A0A931HZE8_9HYPH|nr:hypothetical protein [Methylobrevis albus]MBH0236922.1 hypothetical protein [Methylobrevis albus]
MFRSFGRQAAVAAVTVGAGLVLAGMMPVAAQDPRPAATPDVAAVTIACAPAGCGAAAGQPTVGVRWITVETRVGADTSVLMRTRIFN